MRVMSHITVDMKLVFVKLFDPHNMCDVIVSTG